jgi:Kef-type K+ transport system membrane component KefB
MRNLKNTLFYIIIIGFFSVVIYWLFYLGSKLEIGRNLTIVTSSSHWKDFLNSIGHNLKHPLALLLAQIITIVLVARFFGWLFSKIGQPSVIGEIIAGIALGPSLIGMYFPDFSAVLFPAESLGNLQFLSQIGLILFMFVIGMELDLKVLRTKAHDAVVISHASIIFPFALGILLAYYIYSSYAPAGVPFLSFALFIGIAMSITAFPVLARIVQERGIHKTKLGTIVITCAAADDITAWCILAVVIAIVKAGSFVSAIYIIVLAIVYVFLMIKLVRPFLKRIGDLYSHKDTLSKPIVAIFLLTLIISAYLSEIIGIHALFGAFMAGAIMPDNAKFRNVFIEKVEDVSLVLLLPLFFVFTGLRTEIGLINDIHLWKITGLIVLVAIVGKFLGSALAAKFVGQNWKDSLVIGALMNTRGLMELVVLNIGYDLGVLTPEVFSMMVIMALFTTFMTGPALDFINWLFRKKKEINTTEINEVGKYRILISFENSDTGKSLLRFANGIIKKMRNTTSITTMYLAPSEHSHHFNINDFEKETFDPIIEESKELNQKITTYFKSSTDVYGDISEVANKGEYDLLLVSVNESIYEGTLLGKILGFTTRIINPDNIINQVTGKDNLFENSTFTENTRNLLARTTIPMGLLIDRGLVKMDKIFIPFYSIHDTFTLVYAQKFINNSGAQVTFLDASGEIKKHAEIKEQIRGIEQSAPNHIHLIQDQEMNKEFLQQFDLIVMSLDAWKNLEDTKASWLTDIPSTIILKE